MTKQEYLEKVLRTVIDDVKVSKVQKVYGCKLPEIIQKIVSTNDETIFFDDDTRILSLNEIIDAEKDLHVDFISKKIIPLADFGENDFIVYHFDDNIWSKFNIVDETMFKKRHDLSELLR